MFRQIHEEDGSCGAAGKDGQENRSQLLRASRPEQRFSRIVLCSDMVMPPLLTSARLQSIAFIAPVFRLLKRAPC